MSARRWIFAGAFAAATAAVAFYDATPGAAAGKGSNLICRANGKVFKAKPRTVQGSYSRLLGVFILGSTDFAVNVRTRSASFKHLLLSGVKSGLHDGSTTLPADLDSTVAEYTNAPRLGLGSNSADAPTWVGGGDEMTITVRAFKLGKKRVKQDGKYVVVDVAKVRVTFSGSLPPGDNNVGAANVSITKGVGVATLFVVD